MKTKADRTKSRLVRVRNTRGDVVDHIRQYWAPSLNAWVTVPDEHANVSPARRRALTRMSMEELEMGIAEGAITEDERNFILGM